LAGGVSGGAQAAVDGDNILAGIGEGGLLGLLEGLGGLAAKGLAGKVAGKVGGDTPSEVVGEPKAGGLNASGTLPADIASTFTGGIYSEVTTAAPTTLYRVYGGTAGKMSAWWSRTRPTSPAQAMKDSALDPDWGNTAEHWVSIEVPRGTNFYEGTAAPQAGLPGGGSQVFFTSRVDSSWVNGGGTFP
jgi:filamentous hemagglutinin